MYSGSRLMSVAGALGNGGLATLNLRVLGTGISLVVAEQDKADATFFYGSEQDTSNPEYEVRLSPGFLASLLAKDGRKKHMSLSRITHPHKVWKHGFTGWSGTPSYVPPFADPVFATRFAVARASVVSLDGRNGVVILGDLYAGKTATLLALMERNWRLVSDSLLIVEASSRLALSYTSPIGLRRHTLARYDAALTPLDTRETISEATGRVVLVRAPDLFPNTPSVTTPVTITHAVTLSRDGLAVVDTKSCLHAAATFPDGAYQLLLEALPQRTLILELDSEASMDERVGAIESYVDVR